MFDTLRHDLRRYVKARKDCPSEISYILQFIPVCLFHEGALTMIGHRLARWLAGKKLHLPAWCVSKMFFFITGNYIHHETDIGPGCKISHSSVVIHAQRIGKGFECSANITIGQKTLYISEFPIIGDYVVVGAGARVLADIGDMVIVGANAVVIDPVESGSKAAGIPARRVGDSGKFMEYYRSMI